MTTPEGKVKAQVDRRLKEHFGPRLYQFKPVQNGMGAPGLDYHNCICGLAIYVETKVPGKDLTPRQKITRAKIIAAGGVVYAIHDAAEIDAMIADIETTIKHSYIRRPLPRDTK